MKPSFKSSYQCSISLSINILLVETLLEMLGYAKFIENLMTKKRNLKCETIKVSHHCSAIVINNLVAKKDDQVPSLSHALLGFVNLPKLCVILELVST